MHSYLEIPMDPPHKFQEAVSEHGSKFESHGCALLKPNNLDRPLSYIESEPSLKFKQVMPRRYPEC